MEVIVDVFWKLRVSVMLKKCSKKKALNLTTTNFTPQSLDQDFSNKYEQIEGSTIHKISLCRKNSFRRERIPI